MLATPALVSRLLFFISHLLQNVLTVLHIIDLTEVFMKDVKMCVGRILLFCVSFQEAHVNQCYKHFYYFVTELNIVERKELEPLVSQLLLSR